MAEMSAAQGTVRLVVMPGDGIGPEITAATLHVLRALDRRLGLGLGFEEVPIGLAALKTHGSTLPDASFAAARAADGVVLGPVSHNEYPPVAQGGLNPSGEMRRRLDLFANIRPARSRPGFPPRCGRPVDLVIARENTEGFYADRSMHLGPGEIMPTPDLALSLRKITRAGSTRIAEAAFRLAARRRKHVTAVHKANVLRVSEGLFLDCVREVAAHHPDVAYEERIIDAMAALLVRDASAFDVIVTTNMFGDILSDEAAGLVGGLGMAPGLCIGDGDIAMAQATHGSAPDIAGRGIANPYAMIESTRMMFEWLGHSRKNEAAVRMATSMSRATTAALAGPQARTGDIQGKGNTASFTAAVIRKLEK
ncbi:MAG: isocitrate/isopropylmalate dehydrogenase family protein [Xanthobacteraceae bacterium]